MDKSVLRILCDAIILTKPTASILKNFWHGIDRKQSLSTPSDGMGILQFRYSDIFDSDINWSNSDIFDF